VLFQRLYTKRGLLGFTAARSHSGRVTVITRAPNGLRKLAAAFAMFSRLPGAPA
jgi:hypothetical protein